MEAIAIIGIGCRFPGANSPNAFWQLLRDGKEAIAEIPKNRWDINAFYDPDPTVPGAMSTRWGGFIDRVDEFDADFFGMVADEVEHTDPQQRLFLEVAWEALENAAIVPSDLARSQTGVFIGLCTVDYHRLLYKSFDRLGPYSGTGTTPCITANRLSYLLDLRGPSLSIDAACASSLITVHLACQSLRSHESDLCLAAGVNLILSPDSTIASSQTRLLSIAGHCKPFDASADGYVRGEGCGVVVLKRVSDAVRDGDNILALIRGSAVNQDGLSNSLTAPNGLAQQALIRQALKNADVRSKDISYIDAHAVGTPIGDAIEIKALKTVLMEGRDSTQPCWIGSTKPNIGHLEAASGVAALIKVVLALQHQEIPAHPHLTQLNAYIDLANSPFAIPTELQPWSVGANRRFAGVSAFGFGGTNAHIVLEEAPAPVPLQAQSEPAQSEPAQSEPTHHLLMLSAKTDAALRELVQRYETFLATEAEVSLANLCFTASTGRSHFSHRLCVLTRSLPQLRQQLKAFAAQENAAGLVWGKVTGRRKPKVAFLFPAEAAGEAIDSSLYETQPVFRQAFDRCIDLLRSALTDLPLDLSPSSLLKQINYHPTLLFAGQYALAQLWQSWGITPKAAAGQGVGLYVAACAAGALKLEDALKLVVEQHRSVQSKDVDRFAAVAQAIAYAPARIPVVLSTTGEVVTQAIASPEYWCQHRQQPEPSEQNLDFLAEYELCLKMELTQAQQDMRNQQDCLHLLLRRLAELYIAGAVVNGAGLAQNGRRLQLPTYPFQRQRYWFKHTESDSLATTFSEAGLIAIAETIHSGMPKNTMLKNTISNTAT